MGSLSNWHPDYVPEPGEALLRKELHEMTGEHWWGNLRGGQPGGDPGAEGRRCRVCGKEEWYRGPGY